DRLADERRRLELTLVLVATRIGRILVLDEEILRVGVRVGEAPRDAVVVADDDSRNARERKSHELVARALEADLIPDRRVVDRKMRISREDRLAGRRSRPRERPAVR